MLDIEKVYGEAVDKYSLLLKNFGYEYKGCKEEPFNFGKRFTSLFLNRFLKFELTLNLYIYEGTDSMDGIDISLFIRCPEKNYYHFFLDQYVSEKGWKENVHENLKKTSFDSTSELSEYVSSYFLSLQKLIEEHPEIKEILTGERLEYQKVDWGGFK